MSAALICLRTNPPNLSDAGILSGAPSPENAVALLHHIIKVYSDVPSGAEFVVVNTLAFANELLTLNVDVGRFVTFIPATYAVLNCPGCCFATSCSSQAVKTSFVSLG